MKMVHFEDDMRNKYSESQESPPNRLRQFVFMNRRRWDLDDRTTLVGCALFSRIPQEQERTMSLLMPDLSNVPVWTVQDHNRAHSTDLAWLNG